MSDRAGTRSGRVTLLRAAALACLSLGAAAPAIAYTIPNIATTNAATGVTARTAVLNGVIDTGGSAVSWQFQLGQSAPGYGQVTPLQTIPVGQRTVAVSWAVLGLRPLTIYHFRLVAFAQDFVGQALGQDQSFLTGATGSVLLRDARLKVTHRVVSVPLSCASDTTCTGRFTITVTTKRGNSRRPRTVVCDSSPFKLKAGRKLRIKVKLDPACRSLIKESARHRLKAKFTLLPSSSQFGIGEPITLTL